MNLLTYSLSHKDGCLLQVLRNIDIYFQSEREKGCLKSTIYTLAKRF